MITNPPFSYQSFFCFVKNRRYLDFATRRCYQRDDYIDQTVWMTCDQKDGVLLLYHRRDSSILYF